MSRGRLLSTSLTAGSAAVPRVVGGDGARFELSDGRWVLDASNTAAPLGHCHPELIDAVRGAAAAPVVNEGWGWLERQLVADDLIRIAFGDEDWVGAVRFFISASEANDAALALAQALTGRRSLATRERAYHGASGLARELTVQPHWHGGLSSANGIWAPPSSTVVHRLPAPLGARITGQQDATALDDGWQAQAREMLADAAAVLLDYSQGGVYHSPEYQDTVARIAREEGCLWIADETVTGFGRVGGWLQLTQADSRPDMVVMGKCLAAGGSPAGAIVLSRTLLEKLKGSSWQTYSTFRGHPIQVAAIRAHLRISEREGLTQRAFELDGRFAENMTKLAATHASVRRIDGRGLHWTIEFHGPEWTEWRGQEAEPLASRVALEALERGVLLATSGEQTSVFVAPPLVIADGEIEELFQALDEALNLADREVAGAAA